MEQNEVLSSHLTLQIINNYADYGGAIYIKNVLAA